MFTVRGQISGIKNALEINVVDEIIPQDLTPENCSCCQHDRKTFKRQENIPENPRVLFVNAAMLKAKEIYVFLTVSRVSPNMASVGGVWKDISQSTSRLLKIISPQF